MRFSTIFAISTESSAMIAELRLHPRSARINPH